MNDNFLEIISATSGERRDLFLTAAARLGTTEQNIEKDFWVCWVLDALFHGLPPGGPRLLFKGGTSLSKAFGLISRFSEDIDITVFREDLGQPATVAQLEALSRKKRNARLDEIKLACQYYISTQLLETRPRDPSQVQSRKNENLPAVSNGGRSLSCPKTLQGPVPRCSPRLDRPEGRISSVKK